MPGQRFIRRQLWHLAIAGVVAATSPSWAQSPREVRYRATVDSADAKSINVITNAGQQLTMRLSFDTVILAIVPFRLEDITPGMFIGAAAMPRPNGTELALEVHVFPESMRGTGEGHRPYDLEPRSTMTNGTVGAVTGETGRTLTVRYSDGEKIIVVPPDTPVVTFEPGSRALLVRGAHCIVVGTEEANGSLSASQILVGKDGLVPPM